MNNEKIKVGITIGDYNGIGPEILAPVPFAVLTMSEAERSRIL